MATESQLNAFEEFSIQFCFKFAQHLSEKLRQRLIHSVTQNFPHSGNQTSYKTSLIFTGTRFYIPKIIKDIRALTLLHYFKQLTFNHITP